MSTSWDVWCTERDPQPKYIGRIGGSFDKGGPIDVTWFAYVAHPGGATSSQVEACVEIRRVVPDEPPGKGPVVCVLTFAEVRALVEMAGGRR